MNCRCCLTVYINFDRYSSIVTLVDFRWILYLDISTQSLLIVLSCLLLCLPKNLVSPFFIELIMKEDIQNGFMANQIN